MRKLLMYKNIIFDFGGVMVDFNPKDYLMERFCNASIEDKIFRLTFGSDIWRQLDAGLISRGEANRIMLSRAQEQNCAFEVQEVLDNWTSILHPRRRMLELVRRLKSHGYCVYYLSNIAQDVLDMLMSRELGGVFDGGLASCEVQINKPDPRIYQILMERYQLKAEECIFIDDTRENVQTAFQLGMNGIQMRDSVNTLVRSLATCSVSLR